MDLGKKPLGTEMRAQRDNPVTEPEAQAPRPSVIRETKPYSGVRYLLWRMILSLLLIAMTAAIVAGWFYVQNLQAELGKKDAEITRLQTGTGAATGTQLAGKGFIPQSAVSAVVGDYLKANQSYSGSDANFTYKIVYLDDTFARVNILEVDQADKNKQTVVSTFFLKNVATEEQIAADDANRWVLIWTGDDLIAADKENLKNTFSVPEDVFTKLREA